MGLGGWEPSVHLGLGPVLQEGPHSELGLTRWMVRQGRQLRFSGKKSKTLVHYPLIPPTNWGGS